MQCFRDVRWCLSINIWLWYMYKHYREASSGEAGIVLLLPIHHWVVFFMYILMNRKHHNLQPHSIWTMEFVNCLLKVWCSRTVEGTLRQSHWAVTCCARRTIRENYSLHACSNIMIRECYVRSGLVTVMPLLSELFDESPLQHDDAIPLSKRKNKIQWMQLWNKTFTFMITTKTQTVIL